MLDRYAAFLRPRGVLRFLAISFLARLPIGTLGLSTLLHIRELTGSIAFAGSVVGAQLVSSAAMAPVLGRWIDVRGPARVLQLTAIVPALSILAIHFAGPLALSHAAIFAAAVLTGAFLPPITTIVRTIWRHRFDDERTRQTAFAVDSVLIELSFTLGPALVALLIAVASARKAYGFAWLFTVASVPLLHLSGGLRWWKQAPPGERHLLGPLLQRELLVIYAATFFLTLAFGALEVAYPGYGLQWSLPAWGPALIAINSVGSAIGGLAYGGIHVRMPVERQLPRLMAIFAVPIALHLVAGGPWTIAPLAFLSGLLIAPSMTGMTVIVSRHAPPAYVTEAFTWSATAIVTGIGAGMAAGGALVERFGAQAAIVLCCASGLAAAALSLALRKR